MGGKEKEKERKRGRKAFPIEVAFYANVLSFFLPTKKGEKREKGVSTEHGWRERIYVKRAGLVAGARPREDRNIR